MKTPEQQALDHAKYVERQVAETKRQFRRNREANLVRKIRHLEAHGMKSQARSLRAELTEWREAVKTDLHPEQVVTPAIEAQIEAASIEMPDDGT